MQSDPLTTTRMRAFLIIAGIIIFGSPIYYILAWGLGVKDITIAVFVLLATAAFVIVRLYLNRLRVDKQLSNPAQSLMSAGTTRDWAQKYSKHSRERHKANLNNHGKSQTSRVPRAVDKIARFLNSMALRLITRSDMDKRLDNRLHQQTRWSDEIYP